MLLLYDLRIIFKNQVGKFDQYVHSFFNRKHPEPFGFSVDALVSEAV